MCGRFTQRASAAAIRSAFGVDSLPLFEPRYNVAPTQQVLIVREAPGGEGRKAVMVRWGLIPKWAPDEKIGNRLINARSETAFERRSFKSAVLKRRCLVVSDGWYEWQQQGNRKQPYHFQFPDGKPFAFSGAWERWEKGAESIESCTILTITAAGVIEAFPHRMPIILDPRNYDRWLDQSLQEPERIKSLLTPYGIDDLECYPVSRWVNNPRHEGVTCVEAI